MSHHIRVPWSGLWTGDPRGSWRPGHPPQSPGQSRTACPGYPGTCWFAGMRGFWPLAFGILAFATRAAPSEGPGRWFEPGSSPTSGKRERAQAGHSLTLNLKPLPLPLFPQGLARSGSESPEGGVWSPLVCQEGPSSYWPKPTLQDPPRPALRLLGDFLVSDSSWRTEDGDASLPRAKQKEEADAVPGRHKLPACDLSAALHRERSPAALGFP